MNKYNVPFWIAFIDFHKSFDTLEKWGMRNAWIDCKYVDSIVNIYEYTTLSINLHINTNKIPLNRSIRQRDVITKLFNLKRKDLLKQLPCDDKGININAESYIMSLCKICRRYNYSTIWRWINRNDEETVWNRWRSGSEKLLKKANITQISLVILINIT